MGRITGSRGSSRSFRAAALIAAAKIGAARDSRPNVFTTAVSPHFTREAERCAGSDAADQRSIECSLRPHVIESSQLS